MSEEEYDRKMTEFKVHLALLKERLHHNIEGQCYGWVLKPKKVKRPRSYLIES